ncbi:unnamed protein product [Ectocarpus sp. 4 AP-2014]
MSDMIRCSVHDSQMNGPWFDHVLEEWEAANADPEHILFLHYEAMLEKPQEHIRKIADFVGIKHTPDILAKTAAASSLSFMKQNPRPTYPTPRSTSAKEEWAGGETRLPRRSRRRSTGFMKNKWRGQVCQWTSGTG